MHIYCQWSSITSAETRESTLLRQIITAYCGDVYAKYRTFLNKISSAYGKHWILNRSNSFLWTETGTYFEKRAEKCTCWKLTTPHLKNQEQWNSLLQIDGNPILLTICTGTFSKLSKKMYTVACRRELSSTFGNEAYKLNLTNQNYKYDSYTRNLVGRLFGRCLRNRLLLVRHLLNFYLNYVGNESIERNVLSALKMLRHFCVILPWNRGWYDNLKVVIHFNFLSLCKISLWFSDIIRKSSIFSPSN
jgi:hypothetical protein